MANTTIINVSILEATSNNEVLKSIKTNLTSVENSAFKIATKCAWLCGEAIPCYDSTITNKKPLKRKEVYNKVNKSKATLSRWLKALKYVIDNDLYNDFNSAVYPFSFDKIIMIFDNELTTIDTFENLMKMSVSEIEKLYKADEVEADEVEADEVEADEVEDTSKVVIFEYDGKKFSVHENALIKFIENECTLA